MHTIHRTSTYNLGEEFLSGVVHDGDVVGIPTYRTTDMQHEFRNELQDSTYLVGWTFCRVVMSCVDGEDDVVLRCVGSVEVVTADCETLQSDAEHLSFDAVFHHGLRLGEDLIERILQVMPIEEVVDALILTSVVYP